ncbi:murein hydrolase activator EnvC family protein [Caloranaerobacter ferrireducens]|uniref:murein hydrolase activator EnvC family protein n=1 Tax=Caloranaerobacter ferrireducens TaxID=1323370 RepID=UPI00159EFD55|nr:M23 family metallopeptidase [Caloranaerobacter ferrireducens]
MRVKRDYVYRAKQKSSYKKLFYQLLVSIIIILLIILIKSFNTSFTNDAIRLVQDTVKYDYDFKKLGYKMLKYAKGSSEELDKVTSVFKYQDDVKVGSYFTPTTGIVYKKFGQIKKGDATIFHRGVDILSNDKNIYSIGEGIISEIYKDKILGECIRADFGEIDAVYAHLDNIYVKVGQKITKGEVLGTLKEDSNGDKILHFEIWKDNAPVNPLDYISVSISNLNN